MDNLDISIVDTQNYLCFSGCAELVRVEGKRSSSKLQFIQLETPPKRWRRKFQNRRRAIHGPEKHRFFCIATQGACSCMYTYILFRKYAILSCTNPFPLREFLSIYCAPAFQPIFIKCHANREISVNIFEKTRIACLQWFHCSIFTNLSGQCSKQ